MKTRDRRSSNRWQINMQAKLRLEGEEAPTCCAIHDINFKGAKVCLSRRLSSDVALNLNISFSEDLSFDVQAWIAWYRNVEGFHIHGLYFMRVKDADKDRLYKFIRQNFSQQMHKVTWDGIADSKGGEKMVDRRIFERFQARLPLEFAETQSKRRISARTFDVSAKGLGMVTTEPFENNTPVEVWLDVPDAGEPLYNRGAVVYSKLVGINEYRTGIDLDKPDLMGMARILRML